MQRPVQQVTAGVRRRSGVVATCLLLLVALAVPARAQDARGSIAGRITDSSGAILPGASVTVVNVDTNVGSNVHTNDNGQYTVLFLLPGTYNVTVTAKDAANRTGSTAFTWTVTGSTGTCTPAQLLGNAGFETGTAAPWTTTSGVVDNSSSQAPHSGSWKA